VHRALIHRAVTKGGDGDPAGAVEAAGQRGPDRDRGSGPDNAVLAVKIVFWRRKISRSAAPAVDSGFTAQ
jgi:hypothetical protein